MLTERTGASILSRMSSGRESMIPPLAAAVPSSDALLRLFGCHKLEIRPDDERSGFLSLIDDLDELG